MVLDDATNILINIADTILETSTDLKATEYKRKGRKYRLINNSFQRVREEDKHLIVGPIDENLSILSSFYILKKIGTILTDYRDLCLSIVGVARELELRNWYEKDNSVIEQKSSKYNPIEVYNEALEFYSHVEPHHIENGINILVCSKLNFLHTDHHVGTKLEGLYMKQFIIELYGEEAITSPEVYSAIRSFIHWANIKGILFKLEVPNLWVEPALAADFESFPEILQELKDNVYERYPAGTSKYSLIRKAIDFIADFQYSTLIPLPKEYSNMNWLFQLCHDIETDPIKYHLRAKVKNLSENPVDLNKLSQSNAKECANLLKYCSMVLNAFDIGKFLLNNSKLPKVETFESEEFYLKLVELNEKIDYYEEKDWDYDDVLLRIGHTPDNVHDKVEQMRELFKEDYEDDDSEEEEYIL